MQTRYGYDAFGNRVLKEEGTGRTLYRHNALNQLVAETRDGLEKTYWYDKRGNLTRIMENGQMVQQYVYGALNRLEEAADQAGKVAKYQYNGLGHRVGKLEGTLSRGKLEGLDPRNGIKAETEIGNWNQIRYTIDLTREYHNLLVKEEGERSQTYFWDGNVMSYEENGRQSYYLQDELGSPLRITGTDGTLKETYGYGAFGEDLYGNQGEMQPFGYTGYQRDKVAGTYYAQAREYQVDAGRFLGRDIIKGSVQYPFSLNNYTYCYSIPVLLVDLNGKQPTKKCSGECKELGIPQSDYHECSRVSDDIFFYNDGFENEVKGPSIDKEGLNIVSISGGMIKQGWQDDKDLLQWNIETNAISGDIKLGVSEEYIGIKAEGSLIKEDVGVRIARLFGKDIYIGASLTLFGGGIEAGYDPDENKFRIGASAIIGGGVWFQTRGVECDK